MTENERALLLMLAKSTADIEDIVTRIISGNYDETAMRREIVTLTIQIEQDTERFVMETCK